MARYRYRTVAVKQRRILRFVAAVVAGAGTVGGIAAHQAATQNNVAYSAAATAVEVVDGDTVRIVTGGEKIRVRMLGVDAPEKGQCGAQEATNRLHSLVTQAHHITIRTDPVAGSKDRYNRVLGYIELDGKDAADTLIAEGLVGVWWPQSAPTPSRGTTYREAEKKAQKDKKGSWAACPTVGRQQK